ncbi:MAG: hypothetical protein JXO51_09870, partial [Candidatus Aminicenantes bacterium]|nr:hypothetical protein [Candidatus Aminicenantes bacterium]
MKKGIAIVLLACAWALPAVATQELETAVKQKDWPALAALFADDSHLQLASYFQECQGVGFSPLQPNRLVFYARFGDFAEIGELSFERVNGRYLRLGLKRTVKSLFFVRSFSRFPVSDRLLRVGDAEIHLRRGVVYRAVPMDGLFIFSGEMEFRIRPGSEEERLTLRALERSETFVQEARAGVFVLSRPQELLAGLPEPEPVAAPAEEEALALYEIFRKRWGMPVSFFDELWYFPFAGDFNAAIFHRRPGKSHFRYIFNSALSPDTSLVLLPENKFYLNYNAVKGLKFIQQGIDELKKLELNLFLNPQSGFLSATSVLTFKEPSNLKTVSLDPALVVKGVGRSLRGQLQFFQRGDDYFLMGEDVDKFSFYYAGTVSPGEDAGEPLFTIFGGRRARNVDPYFILNRGQNFYPNPGQHFFRSRVRLSLPDGVMGLASGSLTSRHKLGERTEFVFESAGTKGVSLVCGHFEKLRTIPGRLPIHIYGNPKLNLRNYVSVSEARDCLDFLLEKFGPLEISELNLLLRRQSSFGGWSNQGFVIFNLMENTVLDDDISMVRRLRNDSPVVFTDVNRDGLVHELAHQWWGGVVSWK